MIVQTGSTNPRGPVRRGLRTLGLLTPLLLLVAITGIGLLGAKPEPPAPQSSFLAEASGAPPPPGPSTPPAAPPGPRPAFPTVSADLAVLSVPAAQARLAATTGRPLAVAGWLGPLQTGGACPAATGDTRGALSPLCERRGRLLVADPATADPSAHIHVLIPPGVRLPPAFEVSSGSLPLAVVIVGRAASPGAPCTTSPRGCDEQMTADRVMWAGGSPFDPGPVFDAGLEVPPPFIAFRRLPEALTLATGWSGTILVAAVVRPATVATIDPVAADAMRARPAATGLVWYVRGLETAYDASRFPLDQAPPRLSWAVVDETTGATLARGFEDPDGFPRTVDGLAVRGVASAIAARASDPAGRVTAVAGWFRAWADPRACSQPIDGLPGGGCPRTGLLVDGPWSDGPGAAGAGSGPVIHAVVPPGVAIPDRAVGLDVDGLGPPPPVVVLGRFDGSGTFIVESVAWASGQVLGAGRQVAAGVSASPDDPLLAGPDAARDALDGAASILRMVLAPGADLAAIDPGAAARLRAAGRGTTGPLWYLRGFDGASGAVRWAVVEPGTGRVLARDDAG